MATTAIIDTNDRNSRVNIYFRIFISPLNNKGIKGLGLLILTLFNPKGRTKNYLLKLTLAAINTDNSHHVAIEAEDIDIGLWIAIVWAPTGTIEEVKVGF